MINFAKFINEAQEDKHIENPYNLAKSFINMFNNINHTTYTYVDDMVFKNKYGKMTGCLFISNINAIRMNFYNNKPHSISVWNTGFKFGKTPSIDLVFTNKVITSRNGLTGVIPMLTGTIDSSGNVETRPVIIMPDMTIVEDVNTALDKLFNIFKMTDESDITKYITKYIYDYNPEYTKYFLQKRTEKKTMPLKAIVQELADEVGDEFPAETEQIEYTEEKTAGVIKTEGADETVIDETSIIKNEEELAAQLIADPLPVFEKLNSYVVMVARGISQALLITGQGGVGKSYNVNRILNAFGKKNKDFVIMKGKSTVSAMYKFLYDNYDKICVFDDCDSILQDSDGMNILKGALDSGDIREISWNSKGSDMVDTFGCESHDEIEDRLAEWSNMHKGKVGTPNYFQFQGACIFISNMSVEEITKKDAALLTRCTNVDINLLAKDVILRMQSVLPTIKVYNTKGQDITNAEFKQEVFDYISSDTFLRDPKMRGKQISFRLFNNVFKLRAAGLPAWKELAFGCC